MVRVSSAGTGHWHVGEGADRRANAVLRHLADAEERRLGALRGERLQDRARILRHRPVVERQHDLALGQEIRMAERLSEALVLAGVDLDHARDAERPGRAGLLRGGRGQPGCECEGGREGRADGGHVSPSREKQNQYRSRSYPGSA